MIAARVLAQGRMPIVRSFQQSTHRAQAQGTRSSDWGRIVKSRANQALIYFPGLALVLGWPFAASKLMDGRM
ncbi:hypothetical protein DL766_000156 [Monosporascus sp. MC13-8B]|uniref:Uncharacterized protein n=1 Tax=Monosporascus cannonballus TaxID=155416 RepID=A0ABY0H7C4_9PEZI|nr:hypothetical protein DL762_004577 [Monosporascus cannonballus]RYO92228.1 hypothetical protein DL763_004758 [Monosporascus cannonballus]RYP39947.1 hypothetical protein DL766_000156 [Monosporascus sp. MC13-8B]